MNVLHPQAGGVAPRPRVQRRRDAKRTVYMAQLRAARAVFHAAKARLEQYERAVRVLALAPRNKQAKYQQHAVTLQDAPAQYHAANVAYCAMRSEGHIHLGRAAHTWEGAE